MRPLTPQGLVLQCTTSFPKKISINPVNTRLSFSYLMPVNSSVLIAEGLAHLVFPPLAAVINVAKRFGTFASLAGAFVGQSVFGYWVPTGKRSA